MPVTPGDWVEIAASAIRWVGDEPQPGLVEVEFLDVGGNVHRVIDKTACFAGHDLLPTDAYPVPVMVAAEIGTINTDGTATVELRWQMESTAGRTEFRIALDALRPATG